MAAQEVRRLFSDLDVAISPKPQLAYVFSPQAFAFTVAGLESTLRDIRDRLPGLPDRTAPDYNKIARALAKSRELLNRLRDEEFERLSKYVDLLTRFYESDVAYKRLVAERGAAFADTFRTDVRDRGRRHVISTADSYVLLWLIHHLTKGSESTTSKFRPLPTFSHLLIDEAQYYHPLVLRLFAALARLDQAPQGVMTIVGDLEQLVSFKEGLVSWEAAGLAIPPANINRLQINYRSSQRVYEFLDIYRKVAGFKEEHRKPRIWYSGEGLPAILRECQTRDEEIDVVAERISQIRSNLPTEKWTIAVVLPNSLKSRVLDPLLDELKSYAVSCRWATGEDVKESFEKVIVTDFDSIVGLEFDAVFLVGCDEALTQGRIENIQSVWVALSRPRQFQHLTHVGPVHVLDDSAFDSYRVTASE
jgi:DNA helicase IV